MHVSHTVTQLVDQEVHTVARLHKRTCNLCMQFIQFLSSLHTYNKDAVFPQYLRVHTKSATYAAKSFQLLGASPHTPIICTPNTCYLAPNQGCLDKIMPVLCCHLRPCIRCDHIAARQRLEIVGYINCA